MNKFISEDKKHIDLPVSLGSTVYKASTDCSDVCTFQKKLTDENRDFIQCDMKAICHTRCRKPEKQEVTLVNIGWILENWNDTIFETESKAEEYTRNLVAVHITEMRKLGFLLREDGYSVVPENIDEKTNVDDFWDNRCGICMKLYDDCDCGQTGRR